MLEAARQNRLLAALPVDDLKRWVPHLRAVKWVRDEVLYDVGARYTHAYFPTDAIVSLLYVASDADASEIGMTGNEGVVGASLLMGDEAGSPSRLVVQSPGWAFALDAHFLQADLQRSSVLQLLLRHAQALATQMAQTAACIHHHRLEQQFCRWLLLCLDRLDGSELATTQLAIASRLGVRRAGVSECAQKLEREGTIRCARGTIAVLDRGALERKACGCYHVISGEYRRLVGNPVAAVGGV